MKISFLIAILILSFSFISADSYSFQTYYSGNSEMISSNSYALENSPFSSFTSEKSNVKITSETILEEEGITEDGLEEKEGNKIPLILIFVFIFMELVIFLLVRNRKSLKRLKSSKNNTEKEEKESEE